MQGVFIRASCGIRRCIECAGRSQVCRAWLCWRDPEPSSRHHAALSQKLNIGILYSLGSWCPFYDCLHRLLIIDQVQKRSLFCFRNGGDVVSIAWTVFCTSIIEKTARESRIISEKPKADIYGKTENYGMVRLGNRVEGRQDLILQGEKGEQ